MGETTKRDVVLAALNFQKPPYVPWSWGMTHACRKRLAERLGGTDLDAWQDDHFAGVSARWPGMHEVQPGHFRDAWGVVWDRTVDKDIGTPVDWPIRRPEDLAAYEYPEADDEALYEGLAAHREAAREKFCLYAIGFSLFEKAWSLRGMTELLTDMVERPELVEHLLDAIVESNLKQVRRALELDVDCVYFGDDYGMQHGLIMGPVLWRQFIKPRLARMFEPVRSAGKYVMMHSCGDVDELFDDLAEVGLNLFNPFQPEAMDVFALLEQYRGKLAFHGGMSTQHTLPYGTAEEVAEATAKLLAAGAEGGYIFAPAHAVPGDVPAENLLAMQETLTAQSGYSG